MGDIYIYGNGVYSQIVEVYVTRNGLPQFPITLFYWNKGVGDFI